jgi:N-acyl homoserine lactone hydrolase
MMAAARGQIKGRPERLWVLDYGLFRVHADARVIGIPGFAIRTDAGETILIDTGFPPDYATDAAAASARDGLGRFGEVLSLFAANLPAGQLALIGLSPADVDLVILTHSHIDHVGGIGGFPQAPILLAGAERALPAPLYFGDRRPMAWPARDYLAIDGDAEIAPGLQVLAVPGHVPGQLALWLDLPETGAVLLTSDAISRPAELAEGFADAADPAAAAASAARLLSLADATGAMVVYGHCPAQWPALRKAPDFYG